MVSTSQRNVFLDLFKFFLCYLVIAIHLAGESYWYFPVYRLAVPMFFMISGYYGAHDAVCFHAGGLCYGLFLL